MTLSSVTDLIQESRQTDVNIKQLLAISFFKTVFERVK